MGKGRRSTITNEYFVTPQQSINDIIHTLRLFDNCHSFLDPSSGSGAFVEAALANDYAGDIVAIELENDYFPSELKSRCRYHQGSFFQVEINNRKFDLVFTNPPFSQFPNFLIKSLELLNPGGLVVFLLALSMLKGIERGAFLEQYHPREVYILKRCPPFGWNYHGAAAGYAWVVWEKEWDGEPTRLFWI